MEEINEIMLNAEDSRKRRKEDKVEKKASFMDKYVEKLEVMNAELRDQVGALQDMVTDQSQKISTMDEILDNFTDKESIEIIEILTRERDEAKNSSDQLEWQLDEECKEFEWRIGREKFHFEKEVATGDTLRAKIIEMRDELQRKTQECENMKKTIEQEESMVQEDEKEEKSNIIGDLTADLSNATSKIEALEGKLQDRQLKFAQLEEEKEQFKDDYNHLVRKIGEMEKESMALIRRNDNLKFKVEGQELELQQLRNEAKELLMQTSEDQEWKQWNKN